MSLLTLPFKWPLLPLRAVIRLGQVIETQVQQEYANPARIESELETIDQAERTGEISDDQAADLESQVVMDFIQARQVKAAPADSDEG